MVGRQKRLLITFGTIAGLLLIPLVATLLSSEVNWNLSDFLIMGAVLSIIGLIFEFRPRSNANKYYKWAFAVGLLGAFLLFWVNGAVGIIGNEGHPANLLFLAVFVVGLVGSFISRLKAGGMSFTLYITAAVQMLVPITALLIWPPPDNSWSPSIIGVFLLSAFFALLFLLSGYLFRKSISA